MGLALRHRRGSGGRAGPGGGTAARDVDVVLLDQVGVFGWEVARDRLADELALAGGQVEEAAVAGDVVALRRGVVPLAVGLTVGFAFRLVLFIPFGLLLPLALAGLLTGLLTLALPLPRLLAGLLALPLTGLLAGLTVLRLLARLLTGLP